MSIETEVEPGLDLVSRAREVRRAGHDLIDRMADYLATLESRPVSTPRAPAEVETRFTAPLPRTGRPADEVWDEVWEKVIGDAIHLAHPMYMGHQVAPPLPHAVLADALAGLLNNSTAVWEMSPTGTFVESEVIRWMTELLGYPATSDGTLVSGGSVANLTGLLAARGAVFPASWQAGVARDEAAARAAVFVSADSHYSMERAIGLMGMGADAVVGVPTREGKMDLRALDDALRDARRAGRTPFAIVGTAGSTPTGRFDDLEALADIAEREKLWFHVDGAHGGSHLASPRLRHLLRGIERADSVAWDPHKMMFMPLSAGAIFVRDRNHLDTAFQQSAPYLFHPRSGEARSRDIGKRTLQCSKRLDALKLWVSLQHYGLDYFAHLQERTVDNARALYDLVSAADDFEPMHVPESNILCFRHLPAALRDAAPARVDEFQHAVRERWNVSGRGWITATVLDGRRVLRVTLMNPGTGSEHLEALVRGLREVGKAVLNGAG